MKKILLIGLLFIVCSFCVSADEIRIKTNYTMNMTTWQEENETYFNITLDVEDETYEWLRMHHESDFDESHDIVFDREIECNETDIFNLSQNIYTACIDRSTKYEDCVSNESACQEGWSICRTSLEDYRGASGERDACYENLTSLLTFTEEMNDYDNLKQEKDSEIRDLKKERDDANSGRLTYALLAAVATWFISDSMRKKKEEGGPNPVERGYPRQGGTAFPIPPTAPPRNPMEERGS
jgi:hypothetical protein